MSMLKPKREQKLIKIRKISEKQAKEEMIDYIKLRSRCYPSDIAGALRLDFDLVMSVVDALIKEGRIREIDDNRNHASITAA